MNADERRFGVNVAYDERDGFFAAALAFAEKMALKAENAELPPTGGELRLGDLLNGWFGHGLHNYSCWIGFRRAENGAGEQRSTQRTQRLRRIKAMHRRSMVEFSATFA